MDHPSPSARSGGGGGGGGAATTRREGPAEGPDAVSDESSASSMSDEEDADDVGARYRPQTPTPPPQRRQQRQHQQQQQRQQSPPSPPSPPSHYPPPPRGSREKDIRSERYRERDRERDRDRDRDRITDRDRDRDRDWEPEFKRGGPPSSPSDGDRESPPTPRNVKRQSFAVDDRQYSSGHGGGSSAHRNGHARRRQQSVPPNSAHNGAKRQSITERLMSTWAARTAKEPVGAASSAMAPSRRASSASTTTANNKFNPVGRVREWLDTCNADHGDHCSSPPGDTWRPMWLIDSVNRCLVRARATDRYIALSYVYEPPLPSSRGPVETLRGNLEMLTASMDDADVPQTILDAMWLARKLGIKYLWVDRFCIVQDDDVERDEYVKNMAYVYANAYLTIVAAMGDAETGLTGLLRRTPPSRGAASRKHDDQVLSSRWAGRAWTVQEGMYARRKVYVFEETVTWECHCDVWQGSPAGGGGRLSKMLLKGGGRSGPCQQRTLPAATGFLHPVWPDMDEYARVAMEFSARRVTLMSDTTRALRGITTVLSRSFAGGFIFGMPVSFLDVAMLWQPRAMVRRRMMVQPMTGMNPLPSWSWIGWHYDGVPADLTLWRAAADYVQDAPPPSGRRGGGAERRFKSPYAFRLRSLVSYELTDRATYTPLPNDGMAYRDRRHRRTVPLPAGWSRSNGGFRYAGDPEVVFRYPVPVAEMDPGGAVGGGSPFADFAIGATLLSFSTTVAFLEVDFATARNGAPVDAKAANAVNTGNNTGPAAGLVAPGRGYGVPLAIGNIWSRTGKWCGVVTAHDSWLGLQGANHTGEERLEFIAVSMASERGGSHVFDLDAFRDNMDEDEIVDYVNVLWVERVGGVCYRRGLGHVVQRVWDAVARDRVDILLG